MRKRKAIDRLINECGGDPNIRIPVCAFTSLFSARVFEYVGGRSRDKPVNPSGGPDGKEGEPNDKSSEMSCVGIGKFDDDAYDKSPRFRLVYIGSPSKKDMQILFMLLCLASRKPEMRALSNQCVRGPEASVPGTGENQVCLPAELFVELAVFLYGRGARESTGLFIEDLITLSHREFSIRVPIDKRYSMEYNSIPFSVLVKNKVESKSGGEEVTLDSITITLSDIFFYEKHSKYCAFDVEAVFNGLMGKGGDLFARIVSYASRYMPTVVMQGKNGRGYKTSVPIEAISPGYNTSAKQNKLRTRKAILSKSGLVRPLLMSVSITLVGNAVKMVWTYEKTLQNDECGFVKT